jgi:hypothetical protein
MRKKCGKWHFNYCLVEIICQNGQSALKAAIQGKHTHGDHYSTTASGIEGDRAVAAGAIG